MRNVFIVLLLLTSFFSSAQKKYSSSNPKALRFFDSALNHYDNRKGQAALDALNEAIKADSFFIEAYMLKGDVNFDLRKFEDALSAYNKAVSINPEYFPGTYYSIAKCEYYLGRYADCRAHVNKYLSYDKINPNSRTNAVKLLRNADFSEEAISKPVPFDPINMGDSINTADEEYFPAITADGKTFLFTRRLKKANAVGQMTEEEDFYVSTNVDGKWRKAAPLEEINTSANEGAPALSSDGQYLFFTSCEEMFVDANTRKTNGSCDIFIAKKVGAKYTNPRNLEAPVNTGTWESQPSFSSDGRTLYFIRRNKNAAGKSNSDIMMTRVGDDAKWSVPVSVSDSINTADDESSVFIHPDNQTLYFTSNGHPGMGGLDIYYCKRNPDGTWGKPVNIGYPINTTGDENSLIVSPDGKFGYFASDRANGKGGLDFYQFALYEGARPVPVTYMKGKVMDNDSKKPLLASFELIDLGTGKTVVSSSSNSVTGEFLVCLPTGKSYALNVSRDNYLFYSENFELKVSKTSNDPFLKDVYLKPIKSGESIVLKNIFYETNKFDLKPESMAELNKLVDFLNKNPKIQFEISGHTDNVGTPAYNKGLSERRANSVKDYLIGKGIAATRIVSVGYGDTKPIADNTSEAGRAQNRRTEFKVMAVQ